MANQIKQDFELISKNDNRPFLADLTARKAIGSLPVILFIHGFKGFKDWGHFNLLAQKFAEHGFAFFKFNMSFNGISNDDPNNFTDLEAFGNNNFTKELNDIDTMIDFIHSNPVPELNVDTDKLFVIGHSRGGGISIVKTKEDKRIKGLATWAAVNDFSMGFTDQLVEHWRKEGVHYVENTRTNQMMPIYFQAYHDLMNNRDRYNPKKAISELEQPVIIFHGDKDPTVPVQHAYELKELKPEAELHVVAGADHVFGGSHPFTQDDLHPHTYEVLNKTVSFFKNI
ncbi:alpha/beta hydrolase [Fulvivirga lutea]|uniref:Dienelactone hydrolase family protein n=1 Tax=Fulvivirga lutea TaxID=2810512 RepID=A0A974WIL4_9BACT|nr:alpha/beta fold hydrolase [Fulvivirga lutea]QSE99239.1 dienelactone hydrolase family protein [Fulvivirga lutea]